MTLVLVLGWFSCASGQPPRSPDPPASSSLSDPSPEVNVSAGINRDGLPPELLDVAPIWEHSTESGPRGQQAQVMRLYPDGRVYTWSAQRRITRAGGLPGRVPAPALWRLDAEVSPAGLAAVREAIRAGFLSLAPVVEGQVNDGRARVFRSEFDGVSHTVSSPGGSVPAAVLAVEQALQRGFVVGAVPMDQL